MGEVYQARDTRLDRTVAIKVLPAALAADPEFRGRFDREARAISGLDHPNICALYDVGREKDVDFLVMPFVDGETLATRLERGPLKIAEAMRLAMEVASALEAAHRAGVVHRDLKPANIMLAAGGGPAQAKLLDFGLAKVAAPTFLNVSAAPTTPPELTAAGAILGTFQYMSPEQLEGGEADARSDIFAFGTVVFEMVTGRKAFEGKSRAALIGAILRDDPPPISTVRASSGGSRAGSGSTIATASDPTASGLDRIVRRCLAKHPRDRWQTASDLLEALRWVSEGRSPADLQPVTGRTVSRLERVAWAAAFGLIALTAVWGWLRPQPARQAARFAITLAKGDTLGANGLAISPDGNSVVMTGTHGETTMLFRRGIDQLEALPIRGTEDGEAPFFSPDGRWIGFFTGTALKKVPVEGGPSVTITAAGRRFGASWGIDDTIVFAAGQSSVFVSGQSTDILRVPAAGGTAEVLVPSSRFDGRLLRWPSWTPDGTAVLFTVIPEARALGSARVALYSLKSGAAQIVAEGSTPSYLRSGDLLFARGGSLWAAPLDLNKPAAIRSPKVALEGVQINAGGLALYSIAANGSLAFKPASAGGNRTVVWMTRDGRVQSLIDKPLAYENPRLSPDGRRLAVQIDSDPLAGAASDSDIWVYDIESQVPSRLTFGGGRHTEPVWTPDGTRVIYAGETPSKVQNLFWVAADGTAATQQIAEGKEFQFPRAVTPDGKMLIFTQPGTERKPALWTLPLEGDRTPRVWLESALGRAALSPDGHWLAYESSEGGGLVHINVRAFPGPGGLWEISPGGGIAPQWAPNGKELFYYYQADSIMAVPVTTGTAFTRGLPRLLFPYKFPYGSGYSVAGFGYSVFTDSQRFVLPFASDATDPYIVVALNWAEQLKNNKARDWGFGTRD